MFYYDYEDMKKNIADRKLIAFHGKKSIKDKYLKRVKAHYDADEIAHGIYWENGKGCAVGCTVENNSDAHEAMEKELGIPQILAYLEDVLFEEMKNGDAKQFPLQFLEAIPVGADLSKIVPQLVIWQFEDAEHGLRNIKEVQEDKEAMGWCEEVVALYKRELTGDKPTEDEYYQLYKKIDDAWAWARAWARAWAWAGAWAWARARAWAWAWAGAWAEYDSRILLIRDKLLSLLKEA
jgi:hypothetical protein